VGEAHVAKEATTATASIDDGEALGWFAANVFMQLDEGAAALGSSALAKASGSTLTQGRAGLGCAVKARAGTGNVLEEHLGGLGVLAQRLERWSGGERARVECAAAKCKR
jgi:hypothetical protein